VSDKEIEKQLCLERERKDKQKAGWGLLYLEVFFHFMLCFTLGYIFVEVVVKTVVK